ncbi:MAG: LacI family DNA-binding transcriptional regulator [Phycisphaerae bacterium]
MAVSIDDVARAAQVSISTVSRVINNRLDLVNIRTRERVESAIQRLGYRPNAFARGLMLRRSEIVGLVLPDLHGEFYSEIIRGANQKAREMGYSLVVSSTRESDESHSILAAMQRRTLFDGVAVMFSELTDGIQAVLGSFPVPFVVLDDDISGTLHDSVIIDQHSGTAALVRHLLDKRGVKRLIFVGGPATNVDSRARLDVCRAVLAERGYLLSSNDVFHLDYQYETALALAGRKLESWVGPNTCVFAANDEMAAGVLAAAAGRGVVVPRQFAVVGFDDTRVARMTHPSLTTVRVPMSEMGAQAIDLLCQRIATPERDPIRVSLKPELVVRESCGNGAA